MHASDASLTWLDRLPAIFGVVLLALVVATLALAAQNRSLQDRMSANQAKLQSAQTAANLDNSLIRLLAKAAADHDDKDIKALLAANGVTFTQGAAAPPAPPAKSVAK